MHPHSTPWQLARRAERLEPVGDPRDPEGHRAARHHLAGRRPAGAGELSGRRPCARPASACCADTPREALQYAASEGYGPLREWVAAQLGAQGLQVQAAQVLITTGSQQGLDLVGKVLIDAGSRVAVEAPTYLGALQAFAPYEPEFVAVDCDEEGPLPAGAGRGGRRALPVPAAQLPEPERPQHGRGAPRRAGRTPRRASGLPLVEDNPYGELWFDAPPPPPLAVARADGAIYLGSFSKVLAPGLRLGYLVAPPALYPKLLQAKQAADLHTPGFNQRVVHEVIRNGFLDAHVPTIRARYKAQRDAMRAALDKHLPAGCRWNVPAGGMFFWVELPAGPGRGGAAAAGGGAPAWPTCPARPSIADAPRMNTLRLSFVTVAPAQIDQGMAALGRRAGAGAGSKPEAGHEAPLRPARRVHAPRRCAATRWPWCTTPTGLDDARMAAFARWTNLSETTFLLPPTDAQADYRVRIFTPGGELPFAGHPTLGSCHAWLAAGGQPRQAGMVVQQCGVGLVHVRRDGARLAFAAPPLRRSGPLDAALLRRSARRWRLDDGAMRAHQWVDNGPGWCAVLLDSADARAGAAARLAGAGRPEARRRRRAPGRRRGAVRGARLRSAAATTKTRSPAA